MKAFETRFIAVEDANRVSLQNSNLNQKIEAKIHILKNPRVKNLDLNDCPDRREEDEEADVIAFPFPDSGNPENPIGRKKRSRAESSPLSWSLIKRNYICSKRNLFGSQVTSIYKRYATIEEAQEIQALLDSVMAEMKNKNKLTVQLSNGIYDGLTKEFVAGAVRQTLNCDESIRFMLVQRDYACDTSEVYNRFKGYELQWKQHEDIVENTCSDITSFNECRLCCVINTDCKAFGYANGKCFLKNLSLSAICKDSCKDPDESCKGGKTCLNIKLPLCKHALISDLMETSESSKKLGAYVVSPIGAGNVGHIYGVAKDKMGGSDAIVWRDANSDETWGHTCKEHLLLAKMNLSRKDKTCSKSEHYSENDGKCIENICSKECGINEFCPMKGGDVCVCEEGYDRSENEECVIKSRKKRNINCEYHKCQCTSKHSTNLSAQRCHIDNPTDCIECDIEVCGEWKNEPLSECSVNCGVGTQNAEQCYHWHNGDKTDCTKLEQQCKMLCPGWDDWSDWSACLGDCKLGILPTRTQSRCWNNGEIILCEDCGREKCKEINTEYCIPDDCILEHENCMCTSDDSRVRKSYN